MTCTTSSVRVRAAPDVTWLASPPLAADSQLTGRPFDPLAIPSTIRLSPPHPPQGGAAAGQRLIDGVRRSSHATGAKYLGLAKSGAERKILNGIELQMPKHLRPMIMALVESNLKLIRDGGSIHSTGLVMLRHVAVVNQVKLRVRVRVRVRLVMLRHVAVVNQVSQIASG